LEHLPLLLFINQLISSPVCWGTESQIWFSASDCSRWSGKDLAPHATYSECCPREGPGIGKSIKMK